MINWLVSLYQNNPILATTITYLFVSSAVGALPSPTSNTGFYRFFFDFIHTFTGGIARVVASRNALTNGSTTPVENTQWKPKGAK
jgi:hypothetical protein